MGRSRDGGLSKRRPLPSRTPWVSVLEKGDSSLHFRDRPFPSVPTTPGRSSGSASRRGLMLGYSTPVGVPPQGEMPDPPPPPTPPPGSGRTRGPRLSLIPFLQRNQRNVFLKLSIWHPAQAETFPDERKDPDHF